MAKATVLHIAAHMGGGIGRVLSGIAMHAGQNDAASQYVHKFVLLEKPEKSHFVEACPAAGAEVVVAEDVQEVEEGLKAADIVQLEWWHHPKMAKLLLDFPAAPMRLVIWSHISGCYYPLLPYKFLAVPDKFVFSSAYSWENPFWSLAERDMARTICPVVNSSGNNFAIQELPARNVARDNFTVGYVGTQSYAKLNPACVQYYASVADIPDIHFCFVGDTTNESAIRAEAAQYGFADKLTFVDYVDDVGAEFAQMDVFAYLLSPTHFGTTENVLLEAMAAGLPVVALNQCAEKYLIKHGETGILVNDREEFGQAVRFLHANPAERWRLGENAYHWAKENFDVSVTVRKMCGIYDEVMAGEKSPHEFWSVFGHTGSDAFLTCLPRELRAVLLQENGPDFAAWPYILKGKSKSSLAHFYRHFPADQRLAIWHESLQEYLRRECRRDEEGTTNWHHWLCRRSFGGPALAGGVGSGGSGAPFFKGE